MYLLVGILAELLDYSQEGPNHRAERLLQTLINFTDFLHVSSNFQGLGVGRLFARQQEDVCGGKSLTACWRKFTVSGQRSTQKANLARCVIPMKVSACRGPDVSIPAGPVSSE